MQFDRRTENELSRIGLECLTRVRNRTKEIGERQASAHPIGQHLGGCARRHCQTEHDKPHALWYARRTSPVPSCVYDLLSSSAKSRASSIISTPSSRALSSLEPASSPATRKSVFLLTDPATFPPAASMRCLASSRLIPNVPVSTNVRPPKGPPWRRRALYSNCTPTARRRSTSS